MSTVANLYFYLCGFIAVCGALIAVTAANPVRGAMGLLTMILSVAGLFLALHAQFLAAIQLIVYAGAIVVLFLFVIMLLGPSARAPRDHRGRVSRSIFGGLFVLASLVTMFLSARAAVRPDPLPMADNDFGGIDAFAKALFGEALIPFELSSALLMVAVIGAVAEASKVETPAAKRLREARASFLTGAAPGTGLTGAAPGTGLTGAAPGTGETAE
jgi:NADH-quinone oxidoreductase subunit J